MATAPNPSGDPVIETERLILRPFKPSDFDLIYTLRSDPQVFYWRTPDTRSQTLEWFEARFTDPKSMCYVALLKDDHTQLVGSLGASRLPEIGYTYLPSFWGKGYATEALKGWIETYWQRFPDGHPLLEEKERGTLEAQTGPEDPKSPRVLQKCGFKHVGQDEVEEEGGKMVWLDRWRLDKPGKEN